MTRRAALLGLLAVAAAVLGVALLPAVRTTAAAQPVPCVTALPVPVGDCPSATPSASASTSTSPSNGTTSSFPTFSETSFPTPATTTPEPVASTGDGGLIGVDPGLGTGTQTGAPTTAGPTPVLSPSGQPVRYVVVRSTQLAALPGVIPVVTLVLLGVALGLPLAVSHARRSRSTGGIAMTASSRRWRLVLAAACLAGAALAGIVGWYKVSGEPLLNRQIPYLASAGMVLVVLAATGGALLVAEQLRSDDRRLEELEGAVRTLAAALAPQIESPPRVGTHVAVVTAEEPATE
jgi:hypothetical protein